MNVEETIDSMTEVFTMRYWNDPVLSMVCDPVRDTEFGSKLEKFASRMVATMNTYKGIGLAAPQVGVPIRMFLMHFPDFLNRAGRLAAPPLAVCNPTITLGGEMVQEQEGCLSVPGIYEQVSRPKVALMRYFTVLGEEKEIELSEMNARVAQHEYDHLEGVMFFSRLRVSKQVNKAVERAWEKQKGKIFSKK